MNIQYLFGFQIVTDIMICAGILVLLFRFRKYFKPGSTGLSEDSISELKQMLAESKRFSDQFLQELERGKREMKELASSLEEREKKLDDLLKQAMRFDHLSITGNAKKTDHKENGDCSSEEPYRKILDLAGQGLNEGQISQQLGLPEGEIELILSLSRARSR
jgi:hypothetical protein